ncbi:MAG: urea ABC transporter permease subunit UrtB [Burkholderiaceae bacterium]
MRRRMLNGLRCALSGLVLKVIVLPLFLLLATAGHALTPELSLRVVRGDSDDRIAALSEAVGQPNARTAAFLQALAEERVRLSGDQVYIVQGDQAIDPVTGASKALPSDLEDVMLNNRMRGEIDVALAALKLFSERVDERRAAALAMLKDPDSERTPLIERALNNEPDASVKAILEQAAAAMKLADQDITIREQSARTLGTSRQPEVLLLINQRLSVEPDARVRQALAQAAKQVQDRLRWGEIAGMLFTGASLGSILLLVALGLAITYGLMGVINMAHGELMMIGAYATWGVQVLFRKYLPEAFDFYLLAALPAAFLCAAGVGAVMERLVLKHLYGRPLETLLATWGISLVLMQTVRSLFGAQNVGVENPSWMSGSIQLLPNLQLPWNRMIIIVFALAVLAATALLLARTRLGLFVRGVTQNRQMASCMGVNTARIDTWAFALGSGIAGLAGCALSQIGNVGPDLGQSYIVDAFMVVVLGGVGQLAGTVYAALGLGLVNKLLEGWTGAVLAKIAVLVFIIVFIQKRPQGLFAMKGRSAEA